MVEAPRSLTIVQLVSGESVFGVEKYILTLCKQLTKLGHSVVPVCTKEGAIFEELQSIGLRPHMISCRGYLDKQAQADITRIATESGAHVVHGHLGLDSWFASLVARQTNAKAVASVHLEQPAYMQKPMPVRELWRLVQKWKDAAISHFVATSKGVADALQVREAIPPEKISIIHPGVPLPEPPSLSQKRLARQALGLAEDELVVVAISRLSKEKGVDTLIEAAKLIRMKQPHTKFLIAGEGPEESNLKSLIERLGLSDALSLIGYVQDVSTILSAADLFVQPSRQEAFGIAAAEAMSYCLPVVGTDTSGLREVIIDRRTGRVVPVNDIDAMSDAALELLNSPQIREKMGQSGRERSVAEFSDERMAERMVSVYNKCLTF